jgi:hypothetical protein
LADQVARQIIGGTCDRRVIAGDWYWVVWQDETPFDVFPPLDKSLGPLAERRELQNYQGARTDPSADSSWRVRIKNRARAAGPRGVS